MMAEAKSKSNANEMNEIRPNNELEKIMADTNDNDGLLEYENEVNQQGNHNHNHNNVNDDAKDASIHQRQEHPQSQQQQQQHHLTSVEWDKGVALLMEVEGEHGKASYEYASPTTARSLRNALNRNYASASKTEAYEMLNALGELSKACSSCGDGDEKNNCTGETCASPGREGRDDESNRDNSDTDDERRNPASPSIKSSSDAKMPMQGQKVLQSRMTDLRRNIFALDRNSSYNLGSRRIKQ